MSIKSEVEDFSKKIANDFKREDLKDMLQDFEVDRVGIESEMNDIIESNKKGELDKEINYQREWALLQGKLFVIEQKRDILLMQEYTLRKLDQINLEHEELSKES